MLWNREGLYASHLRRWYRPRERGACYGAIWVGKELEQAKAVVEIQKKSLHAVWQQQRDRSRAAMKERVMLLHPIVGAKAAFRSVGISCASYDRSRRPAMSGPRRRR